MAPPAPTIEGTLKSTINSVGFGLIIAVLSVNFGKLFLQNFFVYIVCAVVSLEFVLFSLYKPRQDYEKFQERGKKAMHTIEGQPQISVSAPDEEDAYTSTHKKRKLKERMMKKEIKEHQKRSGAGAATETLPVPAGTASLGRVESIGKGDKEEEKQRKEREKVEKKEEKAREKEETGKDKTKAGWRKRN